MNSEQQSTVVEPSATTADKENITILTSSSVTNTLIMENNDNLSKIGKVENENIEEHARPTIRYNDNDYWTEIENEDLILNLEPPIFKEKTTEINLATATETSPSDSTSTSISTSITNATTVESVTSRLLRKRDELAKKYGIGEGKHEQTDNKADLDLPKANDIEEGEDRKEQTLEEFKEDLRLKRLARQTAVQDLRNEIHTLRSRLVEAGIDSADKSALLTGIVLKDVPVNLDEKLCTNVVNCAGDADDEDPMSRSRHANIELANAQLALQMANAENLTLSTELGVVQKQVVALKEVISCCKQMLAVKEDQCTQLKSKLDEIESSLAERELKLMSSNLRSEYERQLENIRQLRELYEERQRISAAEHENLQRLISIKRDELKAEQEK